MDDRRKQIKLAYKQNPRPMGVYRIINQRNGKVLIGSSMNLSGALNSQHFQLKAKSHRCKALQEEWDDYGAEAFSFEILETVKAEDFPREEWPKAVSALEEKWLNTVQPYGEKGYNKPRKQ